MTTSVSERKTRRPLVAAALAFAVAVAPAVALADPSEKDPPRAQPSAGEKETARALVLSGREKRRSGELQGSLDDFEKAHKIMGVPTTGIELGKAQIAVGLLVEARTTLLDVVRFRERADDPDAFKRARREAKPLADSLLSRLATVTLAMSGVPSGVTPKVTIDGVAAAGVTGPQKINPGKHEIVVTVGDEEKRATVEIAEGGSEEVKLGFSGHAPPARVEDGSGDGGKPVVTTHTSPLVYIGLAGGGLGLLVGSVTGLLAFSEYSNVKGCRDNMCGPTNHDTIDTGMAFGNVSTVSFIIVGIAAAVTVVGLLTPSTETAPSGARSVAPPPAATGLRVVAMPDGVRATF